MCSSHVCVYGASNLRIGDHMFDIGTVFAGKVATAKVCNTFLISIVNFTEFVNLVYAIES